MQLLLLDREQLVAGGILEDERRADAQRLPVDLERALAVLVFDPEVVADREEFLAHPVFRSAVVAAAAQQWHRRPPFVLAFVCQQRAFAARLTRKGAYGIRTRLQMGVFLSK